MPKARLSSGITLHYQRVGTGPDVVMVHGITGNLAVWHLHLVPALAEEHRLLTYDLRGHGYSDTPPTGYSPDDMADDLLGLLDALELERPVVVGHSYGADVALYLAAEASPSGCAEVVAIEAALPGHGARPPPRGLGRLGLLGRRARAGRARGPPEDRRNDLRYLIRATIDLPKQWGPLRGLPRNPKPLLRLIEETSLPEDYRRIGTLTLERVAALETPVTLMYAERSAFVDTFAYLRDHLPDADPVLLPQTEWGHFGPLEQPAVVAGHLDARARGRPRGGGAGAMRGVRGGRPGRPGDAVLVTGSSTGLGLETALHLAQRGFRVFASVRDEASGEAVRQAAADARRGARACCGSTSPTATRSPPRSRPSPSARAASSGSSTTAASACAARSRTARRTRSAACSRPTCIGTIAVTKAVLPHMRAARCGRIVTVSSIGGRVCGFGVAVYCASKFAQEGLGEGLALELAEFGIQSVLVEPGMIRTSRWGEHRGTAAAAREPGGPYHARFAASEAIADRIVTRSPTRPADVAATIAEALTAEQPRLRYVVGRGARVVVLARRLLPERTFERLYFGGQLRRLERRTGPAPPRRRPRPDPEPERVG